MVNLRSLTRSWMPRGLKKSVQRMLLGYDNYAPSFSSAGEDMILRHIIGSDKQDGFYVDVGAYHPTLFSNTYFFYLYGWRGINVEARPGSRKLFDKVRPRDINLELGISSGRGELTYYFIGEDSTMTASRANSSSTSGCSGRCGARSPSPSSRWRKSSNGTRPRGRP
ncbi:MAG: hypothetical protein LC802_00260 [Acidobacteria bacterium]|nr:hypothetical protein [Acidobacteriota bacterium]